MTTHCEKLHVEPTYVARLKNEGEDEMRGEKEAAETDHLTPARDENLWVVVIVKSCVNEQAGSWLAAQEQSGHFRDLSVVNLYPFIHEKGIV